jgi:uncharacterized membrane protein
MNFKNIKLRLKNSGTVITLASTVILILTTNGIQVDDVRIMNTIKGICTICIILGAMNNPETPGLDIPGK